MNGLIDINQSTYEVIINNKECYKSDDVKYTSIIILTYNQLEYTKLCIESIRKFTPKNKYEIIIVDNHSTDGTVEWLNKQSDLNVIYNSENRGFPAGCNQGIKIAKGENILLLNNDVIVTPNWLNNLDKALWSDDTIGAVGAISNSCSYYQQIEVDYIDIDEMLDFASVHNISNENLWSYRTKLIGFCMLIKKDVLSKVGLLDEVFTPGNFEDDDISFRIICGGYKLLICRDTFIHHFGSVSFGKEINKYNSVMNTNIKKFTDKWKFNPHYSNMIRFDLVDMIDNHTQDNINVLEIGCGTGATLLEIKSRYKNANIYGVEISDGPSKIAKNVCNAIVGNIEEIELPYENKFFDYIILGDVLEHLHNPWKILNDIRKYIKKDGHIIASIPNVMHVSVMRGLTNGNFSYEDAGILDRTHLRFFTLKEIYKLFINSVYDICNVNSVCIPLSKEEEEFIDGMCNLYNKEMRNQYISYQYIVKAKKAIDTVRYSSEEMTKLKYMLMRIDNELDIENSLNTVLEMYYKDKREFEDDIEYIVQCNIINKENVLNRLGVESYQRELYDLSISMLMLGLKINRNNIDTVYNISYFLYKMGESEIALNIINNSSSEIKLDIDIQELLNVIERNSYER